MSLKLHKPTSPWRAEHAVYGVLKAMPAALILGAFLLISLESSGQTVNDYRSVGNGLWSDLATWERWDGSAWLTPTMVEGAPSNGKNLITVRNTDTVTVATNVTIDQATVETGGQIIVNASRTLTIANGSGFDLTVHGSIDNSGTVHTNSNVIITVYGEVFNREANFATSGSGLILFNAGSTYHHLRNGGAIPSANWNAASTCEVAGTEAGNISGLNQVFGNLTWNRVNQTNNQDLPNSGSMSIAGNLTIMSTGSGELRLDDVFLTVGGDFTQTGGRFLLTEQGGANGVEQTLDIAGDFTLSGGTLDMASKNTAVGTINIGGNFTQDGGMLTETSTSTASGAVFLTGTALQTFFSAGGISNSIHFTLDNASGAELDSDVTLPGNLTLTSGLFSLGPFDLQVNGAIATSGPSVFVRTNGNGSLRRTVAASDVLFPIGNSAYNPVTLINTGTSDIFSARVSDQVLSNGSSGDLVTEYVVHRTWFIEEDVAGGSNLNITLKWNADEQDVNFTANASYIAHYTGGAWVSSGVADGTSLSLTFFGVTTLSPFSIGSQNALPIELVAFKAQREGSKVQLDWRTASELNNAFFDIERSANGRDFERIGKVAGAGTSLSPLDYTFTDILPKNGWNYYRLRQEDFDGHFSYSEVQAVLMGKDGDGPRLLLYPNPAASELSLKTNGLVAPGDLLEVLDQTGRKVRSFNAFDAFSTPVDVSELPAGTYFVRMQTASGTVKASFVKQ